METAYRKEQKERLASYFNSQAPSWDGKRRWNSYYKDRLAALCKRLVPEGGSVLEVGCATGELLRQLRASRATGIDISPAMVEIASRKYPDLRFQVADVENHRFQETYDVIVLSDLVHSLLDICQALRQLQGACKPNTRLIFTFHNHLWSPIMGLAERLGIKNKQPVQNWLSPSELSEVLHLNGFETIRTGSHILLPIRIPLLSRLINWLLAPLPLLQRLCFARCTIARRQEQPDSNHQPSVSVIVPCLNEAGNVKPLLQRLPALGSRTEVIFIDGGSTDGTLEAIREETNAARPDRTVRLLTQKGGRGKGVAVREAFAEAGGDILMILDADLSVAPEDLPKFYLALTERKGELINGSRLVYSMEDRAMRFLNFLANHFFRVVFSWLLGQAVWDTLCGTKVLYKEDYERIARGRSYFGDFDPFGDFDLLFGASRFNMKIINIPIRYEARRYGTTKIHRWAHGWLLLRMCVYAARKLKFHD